MSYGYDLEEWVTPQEVRSWWAYLHAHLGWPHLLMARESDTRAPRLVFDLGDVDLDVASNDDRPTDDYFDSAVAQLASADVPVMFERRFLHMRDDVWNMDVTRRALWQLTLAGGAGAVWGVLFDDGPPYPEPAQLRTHQRFWRDRFTLDLDRPGRLPGVDGAYTLRDGAGHRAVFYAEATASVPLALSGMHEPLRGVAVDASSAYHEIDLGALSAVDQVWTAPYASDWAVAVGEF